MKYQRQKLNLYNIYYLIIMKENVTNSKNRQSEKMKHAKKQRRKV